MLNLHDQENFLKARDCIDRDVIVVANAGSGKTKLLVDHYLRLLEKGWQAHQIVAFTFTEKAANELKNRISKAQKKFHLEEASKNPQEMYKRDLNSSFYQEAKIGTIHQFCLKIIQQEAGPFSQNMQLIEEASELQLIENIIYEALQETLIKQEKTSLDLLEHYGANRLKTLLREKIAKQHWMPIDLEIELPETQDLEKHLLNCLSKLSTKISQQLWDEKQNRQWLSFDDLEILALQHIQAPSTKLKKYLSQFQHFLVDEFQDTSPRQLAIIDAIQKQIQGWGKKLTLYCVGDAKQSIYRFRQVDQKVIEASQKRILASGGAQFDFTQNFRSTSQILNLVNEYSSSAFPQSLPSRPYTEQSECSQVQILEFNSADKKITSEEERNHHADFILQHMTQAHYNGTAYENMAIIYRSSASAKPYIERLKAAQIPFSIKGGVNLFEKQEVYDLKNLILFLLNPESENLSLFALLRSPLFALPDLCLFFLGDFSGQKSLWQRLQSANFHQNIEKVFPDKVSKIEWVIETLKKWQTEIAYQSVSEFLERNFWQYQWDELFTSAYQDEEARLTIPQFIDYLQKIEIENLPMSPQYWKEIFYSTEKLKLQKTPLAHLCQEGMGVSLLTIHASKGLEFETLYLVDLARQTYPDYPILQGVGQQEALKLLDQNDQFSSTKRYTAIQDFHKKEDHEESKRLLYVALTRAKKNLYILLNQKSRSGSLQDILIKNLEDEGSHWKKEHE